MNEQVHQPPEVFGRVTGAAVLLTEINDLQSEGWTISGPPLGAGYVLMVPPPSIDEGQAP